MKRIILSKRLQMLALLVTPGNRVADIGCDHGFLPIWLVQSGSIPGALAMDVRKGPLEAAKEHIAACGLGEYISVRISDGLQEYHTGEADTIVCAGMGGRLMEKILTESMEKAKSVSELILQPQSELQEFRGFLRRTGFCILKEDAVYEDGKYYFAMKVVHESRKDEKEKAAAACGKEAKSAESELLLQDMFGRILLEERHPVLKQYLVYRIQIVKELQKTLADSGSEKADIRFRETDRELALLERALAYFQ